MSSVTRTVIRRAIRHRDARFWPTYNENDAVQQRFTWPLVDEIELSILLLATVSGRPTVTNSHGIRSSTTPMTLRRRHPFPGWFTAFPHDRQTRKPSTQTMKAYRQDFVAITFLVTGGDPSTHGLS